MDFLTDTTLLIDLWRERREPGDAVRFLREHADAVVGLPWVVKGEFLRGAVAAGQSTGMVAEFLAAFLVVWPTEDTLRTYAAIYAELRARNAIIGPHDLWIAACAREWRLPLLTRNAGEFGRVEGIDVVGYSTAIICKPSRRGRSAH